MNQKRLRHETSFVTPLVHEQEHIRHQERESLLCHRILHTWLSINSVSTKANLNNYKGFINPWEHTQNIKNIVERIHKTMMLCVKFFQEHFANPYEHDTIVFVISTLNSSLSLHTNILAKKSTTKFFVILLLKMRTPWPISKSSTKRCWMWKNSLSLLP